MGVGVHRAHGESAPVPLTVALLPVAPLSVTLLSVTLLPSRRSRPRRSPLGMGVHEGGGRRRPFL